MADAKEFLEIRIRLADREGRPMDLSHAQAEIALKPKQGPGLVQAMQLMVPAPGAAAALEAAEMPPVRLEDGSTLRLAVLRPRRPFEAPGQATAYFKADVETPPGGGEIAAKLTLALPQGKRVLDLQIPAAGR